ncbi:ABC transporter substrate-binding protein [Teredinibacter sp. KSP-S5-2]|uniref:MlaC/ttg2D family ABC transporter substrate-binding protein n=1 Tax=Teredinibacter sp. KSP-S5-2 TaxID=3034506 RepID=UPI002934BB6E|nr:ABC transporter substrate-binding protein [Teredinibacter sp. KSP-S5-2]WNO09593.1 ABC transporter substrate-binding protein [Teredinibacter sp. KSP-S5-2]
MTANSDCLRGVKAFLFSFLLIAGFAQAQQEESQAKSLSDMTAHEVVDSVAANLLDVVKNGKQAIEDNPQAYYSEVKRVLQPAVNFGYIARNVMGPRYWKQATPEQRAKFQLSFENGLIQTYGKAMANFTISKYEIEPWDGKTFGKNGDKVSVIQKVTSGDGTNKIAYTMKKNKDGVWQLINLGFEGANLGKNFHAQFAQAVKDNNGDVGAAIDSWYKES